MQRIYSPRLYDWSRTEHCKQRNTRKTKVSILGAVVSKLLLRIRWKRFHGLDRSSCAYSPVDTSINHSDESSEKFLANEPPPRRWSKGNENDEFTRGGPFVRPYLPCLFLFVPSYGFRSYHREAHGKLTVAWTLRNEPSSSSSSSARFIAGGWCINVQWKILSRSLSRERLAIIGHRNLRILGSLAARTFHLEK